MEKRLLLALLSTAFFGVPDSLASVSRATDGLRCIELLRVQEPSTRGASTREGLYRETLTELKDVNALRRFAWWRYLPKDSNQSPGTRVLGELMRLGQGQGGGYEGLIADPGVVAHFEAFRAFARATLKTMPGIDAWTLREEFKLHLQKKLTGSTEPTRWYRALALTESDAEALRQTGLKSEFLKIQTSDSARVLRGRLQAFVDARVLDPKGLDLDVGELGPDPLLSVSQDAEVASAIARQYVVKSDQRVVLFELALYELDLIRPGSSKGAIVDSHLLESPPLYVMGKDRLRKVKIDDSIESFVAYAIEPHEIKNVRILDPAETPKLKEL